MKVSDYVIKKLEETNSKVVFMLPGGGAMHLNDSLGKSKILKYVCCQKESGCSIAAESYARNTNTPGLVMVTTGPGGTNALTGVAGAYLESTPMIIISGQVKRIDMINNQHIRQQGMQELDIISVAKPITKYSVCLVDENMIRYHIEKAIFLATHGRKGPVWIDIPLDIQCLDIDIEKQKGFDYTKENVLEEQLSDEELEQKVLMLIEKINNSKRPVILLGNGIRLSGSTNYIKQIEEMFNVPFLTTWGGIDLLKEDDKYYYGRPGGLGYRYSNLIQQNSDLFISIGARLNLLQTGFNHENFARDAYKIMVDIDKYEMSKINVHPDLKINIDCKKFFECAIKNKNKIKRVDRNDWFSYADKMKQKYPIFLKKYEEEIQANTYNLINEISNMLEDNDIYVSGSSGSSIDISMQMLKIKKDIRAYSTKGLASMGYALPSTIGAALSKNANVYTVMGDGGFVMNMQELETIHRLNLPIKMFVLCNGGYGAIKATQTNVFNKHFVACDEMSGLTLPNIKRVADAFDIKTFEIRKNNEIKNVLEEIKKCSEPCLCCVYTNIDLVASPKQVSYKNSLGLMESLPLEYMNPEISNEELKEDMLIEMFKKR